MILKNVEFVKSSAKPEECPRTLLPEFAFIGRSNVGKSSLINMLTSRKNLAKTSVSPGKTRLINHFIIDNSWYLVDLPGYGYAKVSKKNRSKFGRLIEAYIGQSQSLECVFILIDSRIKAQKSDLDFITWLGVNSVPFAIIFTKIDKPNKKDLHRNIEDFKVELLKDWETIPDYFLSSSAEDKGREEILNFIFGILA